MMNVYPQMKYIHMGRIEVLDIQGIERHSFDLWRLCIFEMKRDLFKTQRGLPHH